MKVTISKLRLFCALITVLWLSSCTPSDPPKIRLGTNLWPGYEPLYVAREKGIFNDLNIELIELRSATQVINSFRNGALNMAALTIDEAIRLKSLGADIKVIWIFDFSAGADALVAQSSITQIQEVNTIGAERTALGEYFLNRFMDIHEFSENSLTVQYIEVDKHENAMINQNLDAIITFEPVLSRLQQKGFKVLFDSNDLAKEIIDVLVVETQFANNNRQLVFDVLKAYSTQQESISQNLENNLSHLNMRLKLDENSLRKAFSRIQIPSVEDQIETMESEALQDNLRKYHKIIHANSEKDGTCDCAELIDVSFLRDLASEN